VSDGKKNVGIRITGTDETHPAIKSAVGELNTLKSTATGVFDTIRAHWQGLLAIMAGGALFKEAIESTVEWTVSVVSLAKRLGITTEEASGLNVALKHFGIDGADYITLVQKMTRQLRTHGESFAALGIQTKDQNGEWRNSNAVMKDAIDRLNDLKAGTDRNIATQALFGARVGNITGILKLTSEVFAESQEKARKYHLVVGPEGAAQVRHYKEAMQDLKLIGESLSVQMGTTLLPVLLRLAEALGDKGPKAADFFGATLKFAAKAALEGYAAFNALAEGIRFLKVLLTAPVGKGWVDTVSDAWFQMGENVTKVNEDVLNSMVRINGFGGAKPKESAPLTGGTLGGDDLTDARKKRDEAHRRALEHIADLAEVGKSATRAHESLNALFAIEQSLARVIADGTKSLRDRSFAQKEYEAAHKARIAIMAADRDGWEKLNEAIDAQRRTAALPNNATASIEGNVQWQRTIAEIGLRAKQGTVIDAAQVPQLSFMDALAKKWEDHRKQLLDTGDAYRSFGTVLADIVSGPIAQFAQSTAMAMGAMIVGSKSAGQAFRSALTSALSGIARLEGDYYTGKAIAAAGDALIGNPFAIFAHSQYLLAAAAMYAVSGAASSLASGGGGGGGAGAGGGNVSSFNNALGVNAPGKLTVQWPGSRKSWVDPTDPVDQQAILDMLTKLAGNRDIDIQFAGGN
jgi:hypothetical protein